MRNKLITRSNRMPIFKLNKCNKKMMTINMTSTNNMTKMANI